MKTNKKYVAPKLSAEILESSDVITSSASGHDQLDNWMSDNFLPMEDQL